jgi:hypothetical protein
MIGLDGYTISTGLISGEMDPSIVSVPLDVDERIEIGWIHHQTASLTAQAQRFVEEMRGVVGGYGVRVLT